MPNRTGNILAHDYGSKEVSHHLWSKDDRR